MIENNYYLQIVNILNNMTPLRCRALCLISANLAIDKVALNDCNKNQFIYSGLNSIELIWIIKTIAYELYGFILHPYVYVKSFSFITLYLANWLSKT